MLTRSLRLFTAGLVAAALMLTPTAPAAAETTATTPADRAAVAERRTPEALRLRCRGVTRRGRIAVLCRWSGSTSADLAGYRLRRGGDGHRRVVARTARQGVDDARVRVGVRYAYRVEAVDTSGRVIGLSRVVRAGVPASRG